MSKKKKIIIAVFLGWAGGYRFCRRQYLLGLLYLFTFGLFGFGWIFDIICSLCDTTSKPDIAVGPPPVASLRARVVGVTFPCDNVHWTRQEALQHIAWKDTLRIVPYSFEGDPAYYVVIDRTNTDIGNLSASLAKKISEKYSDCSIKVADYNITENSRGILGCVLTLEFYKN